MHPVVSLETDLRKREGRLKVSKIRNATSMHHLDDSNRCKGNRPGVKSRAGPTIKHQSSTHDTHSIPGKISGPNTALPETVSLFARRTTRHPSHAAFLSPG